jgi:hypothetical protein
MERFNLKKLNKVEGKEQYHVEISNRFTALGNLDDDDDVDINRAWETIRDNIKISARRSLGYYELKNKPWFNKGCSILLEQRKQDKLQWLQDPSEINGNNLNNIRHDASRHFRNREREYLKDKINQLATNSKNKNIRDLYRNKIKIAKRCFQNMAQFSYLGMTITNQNLIQKEIKRRLNSGNACYHSVQNSVFPCAV